MFRSVIIATLAAAAFASPALATNYALSDLVTDDQAALTALGYAPAAHVDANLVNPWGIDRGATGGWEVANQPQSKLTFYSGSGASSHAAVTIPQAPAVPGPPTGATGLVHNATTDFDLPGGGAATIIVANLDGSISGWNAAAGGSGVKMVAGLADGNVAIYTGLASGSSGGSNYLYAANGITGAIDVYDSGWNHTTLAGSFRDPGANPDGLVPFNIQNLGGKLWVTYAVPGPSASEAPLGQGFVSVFETDGTFDKRFATGGALLSPWALAMAPGDFGAFSNDVLIGNFSSSHDAYINAYRPDGIFAGTLGAGGTPISLPELWGIEFGNGAGAGSSSTLYAAAGIDDEKHGLFASVNTVPEPSSWALLIAGFGAVGLRQRRRRAVVAV